ncbi:TPA: DUF4942 domain-containing protein [Vibrio vulnificus]|uniref:DUF4942 domain-containing protein n=1 Tax=Vibrio vulnificus TaxID=672 RepID=A0A8H9K6B3_VIBVL|nr:DUF4942 domain-containing protein [Vibrio vulnificus]
MNNIFEYKVIDHMIANRDKMIEQYYNSLLLVKESVRLANEINDLFGDKHQSFHQSFDTVFYDLNRSIGNSCAKQMYPSASDIVRKTDKQLKDIVTKVIDRDCWKFLYNKLGIIGTMSSQQSKTFYEKLDLEPPTFARGVIEAALVGVFESRHELMFEGLIQTITSADNKYTHNSQFMFGKKFIFENAFYDYGGTFKLHSPSELQTVLSYIWRWVFMNSYQLGQEGITSGNLWSELDKVVQDSKGDIDEIRSVFIMGIEFRFFLKRTVHVLLPDSIRDKLNEDLSKTKALPKPS